VNNVTINTGRLAKWQLRDAGSFYRGFSCNGRCSNSIVVSLEI
jgi:hypothetical protein